MANNNNQTSLANHSKNKLLDCLEVKVISKIHKALLYSDQIRQPNSHRLVVYLVKILIKVRDCLDKKIKDKDYLVNLIKVII